MLCVEAQVGNNRRRAGQGRAGRAALGRRAEPPVWRYDVTHLTFERHLGPSGCGTLEGSLL